MPFPFVTRSHHEEVIAQYKERVSALEKELHRLTDHIFQNAFGIQLHDTLPVAEPVQPESAQVVVDVPELSEEEREKAADIRQLAAIRRTSPSRLGDEMTNIMQRRAVRMARAAFPTHIAPAQDHPANQVFDKAKREALA